MSIVDHLRIKEQKKEMEGHMVLVWLVLKMEMQNYMYISFMREWVKIHIIL